MCFECGLFALRLEDFAYIGAAVLPIIMSAVWGAIAASVFPIATLPRDANAPPPSIAFVVWTDDG